MKRYYESKLPKIVAERLRREHGFDVNADIVPSRVGVPVPTGLTPDEWRKQSERFFEL